MSKQREVERGVDYLSWLYAQYGRKAIKPSVLRLIKDAAKAAAKEDAHG